MDALAVEPSPSSGLRESAPPPNPPRAPAVFSTAEIAECTCPDWCERDHDRD